MLATSRWLRLLRRFRLYREYELQRWDLKVMGTELARLRYEAGLAGPHVTLPEQPSVAGLTSRSCRQSDIEQDWLRYWCRVLYCYPHYHRKLWEDCFVLQALWENGLLEPGRRGLGFAVGQEWLPSVFARRGIAVMATDLESEDSRAQEWLRTDQHGAGAAKNRLYVEHLLDRETFTRQVRFRAVDMAALPDDLEGPYDFLWSVCAFEHLGTLEKGLFFVERAMRYLRPGGIAVHTTELNLDDTAETVSTGRTVLYQRRHLDALGERLARAGHTMLPLDSTAGEGVLDRYVDLPPFAEERHALGEMHPPHLRLAFRGFPATSVGLIIRAAG